MTEIIDTIDDFDWLDDDDGSKLLEFECFCRRNGFHPWPDSMPVGWDKIYDCYEFAGHGPLIYSKPRCRWRHRFLWWLVNLLPR